MLKGLSKREHITVFLSTVILIFILLFTIFWLLSTPAEMYGYWDSAPDGKYVLYVSVAVSINVTDVTQIHPSTISFPLSESSGYSLHGIWNCSKDVTLPSTFTLSPHEIPLTDWDGKKWVVTGYFKNQIASGYAEIELKNNVIVNVKGKDSS